jgi:NTP pyrophosphatase (non-canonical NTP hydrolase)
MNNSITPQIANDIEKVSQQMNASLDEPTIDTALTVAILCSENVDKFIEENGIMFGVDESVLRTVYSLAISNVISALLELKTPQKPEREIHETTPELTNLGVAMFYVIVRCYERHITVSAPRVMRIDQINAIASALDVELTSDRAYRIYGTIDSSNAVDIDARSPVSIDIVSGDIRDWEWLDCKYIVVDGKLKPLADDTAFAGTLKPTKSKMLPNILSEEDYDKHMMKDAETAVDAISNLTEVMINDIASRIHATAVDKGWWNEELHEGRPRNDAECIALMHSELSEALEALRSGSQIRNANAFGESSPLLGKRSEHIPDFLAIEEEYADVIIRILDHAHMRGWNIGGALAAKMKFNETRPYKHGGKAF